MIALLASLANYPPIKTGQLLLERLAVDAHQVVQRVVTAVAFAQFEYKFRVDGLEVTQHGVTGGRLEGTLVAGAAKGHHSGVQAVVLEKSIS